MLFEKKGGFKKCYCLLSKAQQPFVFPQLWMLISHRSPRPSLWGYGTDSFLNYLKTPLKATRKEKCEISIQASQKENHFFLWSLEKCMVWSDIYWDTLGDLQISGSSCSLERQDIYEKKNWPLMELLNSLGLSLQGVTHMLDILPTKALWRSPFSLLFFSTNHISPTIVKQ